MVIDGFHAPLLFTTGSWWCAAQVSAVLARWETSLGGKGQSLRVQVWDRMRGTVPAVVSSFILMGMVLTAVALVSRTRGVVSALIDLVYAVSLLSCAMSELFFVKEEQALLQDSARTARKWFLGMRVYATMAGLSVTLPHFYTLKPVPAVWPSLPVLQAPLAMAFAGTSLLCCVGYSEFLNLLLVSTTATTGLFRALGARLRRAEGSEEELRPLVRLHGELNSAAQVLKNLYAPYLPYFLTAPLGGTALATCGFLFGTFSSNFLSLVPQIFIFFIPMCLAGDALQYDSGEGLAASAYNADWLSWPARTRRTAHCIMARATRPQVLSVKAFGHADCHACLSVLKTWFSFLQTLTNLSGISADGSH
ncbi:Odorant receptor 94b [Frankliniella fusca]|uniref:Odorant receptor n=1 Tax=Frankliniella fusca TaxID=407009 RepID=A0AAE1LQS5_9NEOP|nr:Odorant receptor 94b [Frankliniella fusca]